MKRFIIGLLAFSVLTLVSCNKDEENNSNQTATSYTVTVNTSDATMGSVDISPNATSYTAGTQVTIIANANQGYRFVRWEGGNAGTANPYTFSVNSNATYTALFEAYNPPSPADDFVGDYLLNGTLTLSLPDMLGGTQTQDITDVPISIERNGDNGDVKIIMGDAEHDGYVNNSGLHIDPVVINYTLGQFTVALTVTIPTISKPVNGSTSCTAAITASAYGLTITGTADVEATKVD